MDSISRFPTTWMRSFYAHIWADFYKEPVDDLPYQEDDIRSVLRHTFLNGEWWAVYDIIEFSLSSERNHNSGVLQGLISTVLKEEMAGFRLVRGSFVEITDEQEIVAIEEAFAASASDRFTPVRAHVTSALQLLSDRRAPDYRNSIKESILLSKQLLKSLPATRRSNSGLP